MKKLLYISTFLSVFCAQAQSVTPQVFGAAAGSTTIAGNTYQYSVGEMVLVNTETSAGVILTQGFLQPSNDAPSSIETFVNNININVYPNPTTDWLNISFNKSVSESIQLVLFDASGRIVIQEQHLDSGAENKLVLNLSNLASGAYMLHVLTAENQQLPAYFSVQKLN